MSNTDYTSMWKDLGLDLQAHHQLLQTLGQAYQNTFLSQSRRPEAMKYFDFVIGEAHGLRVRELLDARASGRKVIGSFCVFVPEELILALDGIAIGLCTGAPLGQEEAERLLPRNTCALIKSAFGFKLTRICPFLEAADLIAGENTCDGKKKAFEIFATLDGPPFHQMDIPQTNSTDGKALLKSEYSKFMSILEKLTGRRYTAAKLSEAIETVNAKRRALNRLQTIRESDPSPISGLDALLINQIAFYDDPVRFTDSVNNLCDELESTMAIEKGDCNERVKTRIVLSGCPMALPNWKLPAIIEKSGAIIVGEELCTGRRGLSGEVASELSDDSVDSLLDAITHRYMSINCAVFTPNQNRIKDIVKLCERTAADGVIHYSLQFCQPYQIEARGVSADLESRGIPVLEFETDYSAEDWGQLSTRVQAFLERIEI
ncbi:MAG: 3-hydroxyacyl-ACP dehydratase [Candidatus Wallbacteria bacterium HGW-Wallbacteria-1]|jgi:benzoyl-CoA reductase/2-hydroxyglutaryl-CoA dehydratase subunit BcrC/BadD/HgdB|uniref:3-hydroxyacyl-ACP dehydratase n=1 Tax=Candidatus Wallbacteria bacterium HGW-Wallbacteria-1 TaxID=2013854 RepID=A0A2N1PPK6_9BACT|nr:MAG: 3-hydroxyacyl-ACP dehydratase [Candidatus Wallbacteria bacterium HGW-Wallbacteria-1]